MGRARLKPKPHGAMPPAQSLRAVRAVIFDVYGTLLEVGPTPPDADARWTTLFRETLGVAPPLSREAFADRANEIIAREHGAARRRGIAKLVYTSTALVVGEPRGVLGTEETPHRGYYLSRYEKAKALAERVAEEYLAAGLPVVILRPAAVLGPGDLKTTGRTLIEVLNRRVPALVRGVLSVADIDDVAEAHLAAETRLPGERYIVAAAVVTAEEIFTEACRLAGVRRPPFVPAPAAHVFAALEELRARLTGGRPMLARETVRLLAHGFRVDGAKAARELGLRYRPWRDSLRRAVGWYWEQGLLRHRPSVLG